MMTNPATSAPSNAVNSQPKLTAADFNAPEANTPPFQQVLAAHTQSAGTEPPSPAIPGNPRLKTSGAQAKPTGQAALSDKPANRQAVSTDWAAKTEPVNTAQTSVGINKVAGTDTERPDSSSEAARESLLSLNEWLGMPVSTAGASADMVAGTLAAPAVPLTHVPDLTTADSSSTKTNPIEISAADLSAADLSAAALNTTRLALPAADRLAAQLTQTASDGARSPAHTQQHTEVNREPTAGKPAYQALASDTLADTLQQARSRPLLQEAPGRFQLGNGQLDTALAAVRPDSPASTTAHGANSDLPYEPVAESHLIAESRQIAFTPPSQTGAAPGTPANAATSLMPPAPYIDSYPGRTGWNQAISQQVLWMVGAQEQTATLTLNPPDLGPLQIVIQVSNEQASASFSSDHQEVRQALQDGMEHLRERMKEAGVTLGETSVGSGQRHAEQHAQHSGTQATNQPSRHANSATLQALIGTPPRSSLQQGLVDLYA